MRALVCGGREFKDRFYLFTVLDQLKIRHGIDSVIHGGARGADILAGEWAEEHNLPVAVYKADWNRWGSRAGLIRNQLMLDQGRPDIVVAFRGGAGTAHMVNIARKAGVPVSENNLV